MSNTKLFDITYKEKYCGKNFIINLINVLHDISYTLYDCSSGIRIEANTITDEIPFKYLERKFADDDNINPINYIFYKNVKVDKRGYDYKKSRLMINNFRSHLHIIDKPDDIDTHFTLSHRLGRNNLPHIYFNIKVNSKNEIVFSPLCSSIRNINDNVDRCVDKFTLTNNLTVQDIVFCSHILNLNFLCKNIISEDVAIDFNLHNSRINENNLTDLGELTSEQKKIYLIYADTTYFKNLYELSFTQLFNLFRDILKYAPALPKYTKSILNPQTISNDNPLNPPSILTNNCYNESFKSKIDKRDRIFFDNIKRNYNCYKLYDDSTILLRSLNHKQLQDFYSDRSYFNTITDSIYNFVARLNLWSKFNLELNQIYFQIKSILNFYNNDIITIPPDLKLNIDHIFNNFSIFEQFKNSIDKLILYEIFNDRYEKSDIEYTNLPTRCLEKSSEFARIMDKSERNDFYNLIYSIMGYNATFKDFDIIYNLKNDSGNILDPKEFLENIIRPKYEKVTAEIEKIRLEEERKLEEKTRLEKEAEIEEEKRIADDEKKLIEAKQKAEKEKIKAEAIAIQLNNRRISEFFECLKKCFNKKPVDYNCVNIELNKILTDPYFNKYSGTGEFKSKYANLLDIDIAIDYFANDNNYLESKINLSKYFRISDDKGKSKGKVKRKGGDVNYYNKYIKYKLKYLKLKNNIIN
jgi:hypothetical protein